MSILCCPRQWKERSVLMHSFIRHLLFSRHDSGHWSHSLNKLCPLSSRSSQPDGLNSSPRCNINNIMLCTNDLTSFWVCLLTYNMGRVVWDPLPGWAPAYMARYCWYHPFNYYLLGSSMDHTWWRYFAEITSQGCYPFPWKVLREKRTLRLETEIPQGVMLH